MNVQHSEYEQMHKGVGHRVVIMRREVSASFWAVVDGVPICESHPRTHRSLPGARKHASDYIKGLTGGGKENSDPSE